MKLKSLANYKPIVMEPISIDNRVINGQTVMVKVYPIGYAVAPTCERIMVGSRLAWQKHKDKRHE